MATPPDERAVPPEQPTTGGSMSAAPVGTQAFEVHLTNFSGPFDLLLGLIAKHKLDITEVALAQVTDEFIAHIRGAEKQWDLGQASEFLVIAATLLDLKAARLLPSADVEDAEDLELLEARDLLFARLLQYRAYKLVAADLAERFATEGRRFPRPGHPRAPPGGPAAGAGLADRSRAAGGAGGEGRTAEGGTARCRHQPPARPGGQRPGAGGRAGGPAAARWRDVVPRADGRRRGDGRDRREVPGPAGAVPRGCRRVRPGHAAGRADVRWTGSEEGEIEVSDDFDTLDTTLDAELARDGAAEEDA